MYTNCTYLGDLVAHCTPGARLRDRSRRFTLPCTTICNERHFRTPSVRICTVPQSLSRTAHLGCEYINRTNVGHPVAHCTLGARLRDGSRPLTIPWITTCRRTAFLYTICTKLYTSHMSDNYNCVKLCVHKLYLPGRSRSALYTSCKYPRQLTAVHPTMYNNLQRTAFSYTFSTYLSISPNSDPNSSHRLCEH